MALYSDKVMDHFRNPRNVGVIEDADGVGEVGNAKCGDIMKIYLKILLFLLPSKKPALPPGGLVWRLKPEVVCADKLAYVFWKPGAWEGLEMSGLQAWQTRMCCPGCLRQVAGWQDFCGEILQCLLQT